MSEHNVYVDWPCEHDEHQGGERRWTPRTWGSWVPHIEGCGWNIWENQVECLTRVASLSVVLWISCRVPIIVNLLQLNTNQLAHQSGWSCKTPPTRQSSCRPIPTSTRSSSRPGAWLGWKILPSRSPSTLGWECWSGGDCGTHCHDSKPSNAMYFCIYFIKTTPSGSQAARTLTSPCQSTAGLVTMDREAAMSTLSMSSRTLTLSCRYV